MIRRIPRVLVLAALFLPWVKAYPEERKLPDKVWAILNEADQLELLSLDPDQEKEAKDKFHGWNVLGKTGIKDKKAREGVVSAVSKGVKESDGTRANCFEPRHGIRATKEKQTVDLVICFECLSVEIYLDGGNKREGDPIAITKSPETALDKVLRDAGVNLAPKPEKDR
jgi:hypothetical protein